MRQRKIKCNYRCWGKIISDVWLTFCSLINRDKWAQTSEHSHSLSPSWATAWNDLIISLIVAIKKTSRSCQYFGDSFGMNEPKIKKCSSVHMIVNLCIKKSFTNASFAMCIIWDNFSHARRHHTYCQSLIARFPDNFSLSRNISKLSLQVI